ncbi:MAG: HAD family hydrolase [Roseburia sp.]|nr:HAD family hydrolase [Anaeroplasma bactoclasticum]MCM1196658.1 HAD family hydrolase [Roseburia sp.]MCM1557689.1 HAD family hydrolase [Anaeroplasma bactoclasticum]
MKWLFFDLGSTLIDERDCEAHRFSDLLKQSHRFTYEDLTEKYRYYIGKNQSPYKAIVKDFNLTPTKWPFHLEKLYPEVPYVLAELAKKYHLGVIANQSLGTEDRLIQFGIRKYFDVIISSSEVGYSKPDLEIFKMALDFCRCLPSEAYMIGDRLDNDIEPAGNLKMHTLWVKQGIFAESNLESIKNKPEIIVNHISEILSYL